MALIVEDGSGLANAESYNTLAEIKAYADAHGMIFPITGDDELPAEQAARRGASWLDGRYRGSYPGRRKNGRRQGLEWPRVDAWDNSCPAEPIADDEVPAEIKAAHAEATVREFAEPGSLSPDVTVGQIAKRERIEGAVEVEYFGGAGAADQRPVVGTIDDILGSLFSVSRGPALFGRAVRA